MEPLLPENAQTFQKKFCSLLKTEFQTYFLFHPHSLPSDCDSEKGIWLQKTETVFLRRYQPHPCSSSLLVTACQRTEYVKVDPQSCWNPEEEEK